MRDHDLRVGEIRPHVGEIGRRSSGGPHARRTSPCVDQYARTRSSFGAVLRELSRFLIRNASPANVRFSIHREHHETDVALAVMLDRLGDDWLLA